MNNPKSSLSGALRAFLLLAAMALPFATPGHAAEMSASLKATIKTAVEKNTGGKVIADSVKPSPIPGLFEVVTGMDVMYVDATGRYGIEGQLIDMQKQVDLTSVRRDELSRIDFSKLPLELAIKTVRGTGKRTLVVFEDPLCPACRALNKFTAQLTDVTLYTFLYPISQPASVALVQAAWCAPDRAAAWAAVMQGVKPELSRQGCDLSGLARIQAVGDELKVDVTPTTFMASGRRFIGTTAPDVLISALDEAARK